jgi:hypothetical protein
MQVLVFPNTLGWRFCEFSSLFPVLNPTMEQAVNVPTKMRHKIRSKTPPLDCPAVLRAFINSRS